MSIIEKAVGKLDADNNSTATNRKQFSSIRNRRGSLGGKNIRSTLDVVDDDESSSVAIDFDRLDEYGLYYSNQITKQAQDELRRIKRIIVKLAFNSNATQSSYPSNVFMITSALPNEGKTYTSTNLAMALAKEKSAGVVLVDADIPKRRLSLGFGINDRLGLVDILSRKKDITFTDIVLHTEIPHLALISAGVDAQSDPEIFTDFFAEGIIHELSSRYPDRIILIDTPPLLLTSHAASLAQFVGQIIIVVESGNTENRQISEAVELLDKNKTIGFIMNKSTGKRISKYYKEYGEYYSPDSD